MVNLAKFFWLRLFMLRIPVLFHDLLQPSKGLPTDVKRLWCTTRECVGIKIKAKNFLHIFHAKFLYPYQGEDMPVSISNNFSTFGEARSQSFNRNWNSTRRFWARPSDVSLDAIGWTKLRPLADSNFLKTFA